MNCSNFFFGYAVVFSCYQTINVNIICCVVTLVRTVAVPHNISETNARSFVWITDIPVIPLEFKARVLGVFLVHLRDDTCLTSWQATISTLIHFQSWRGCSNGWPLVISNWIRFYKWLPNSLWKGNWLFHLLHSDFLMFSCNITPASNVSSTLNIHP